MRYVKTTPLLLLLLALSGAAVGQRVRLPDHNTIGWLVYAGDHSVSRRWQLHTEAQVRRVRVVAAWQQLLLRGGANYQLSERVTVGAAYTFLRTYPYGDYPTASQGRAFPEHRSYEQVQWRGTDDTRLRLTHRLRLEQRWQGVIENLRVVDWAYENRIRYQLAAQLPLRGPTLDDHEFYLTAFDEIFLSFGRNVGRNVFNQNRLAGGLGYRFARSFRLEAQYLYQITQHPDPDPATSLAVFEYNQGPRVVVAYDLDFTR